MCLVLKGQIKQTKTVFPFVVFASAMTALAKGQSHHKRNTSLPKEWLGMTRVLQSHSICQEHIPLLTAFFFSSPSHYTSLLCHGKLQYCTLCYIVPLLNEFWNICTAWTTLQRHQKGNFMCDKYPAWTAQTLAKRQLLRSNKQVFRTFYQENLLVEMLVSVHRLGNKIMDPFFCFLSHPIWPYFQKVSACIRVAYKKPQLKCSNMNYTAHFIPSKVKSIKHWLQLQHN